MRTAPWLRSIRLDVISKDEAGIYDAEVQKKNTGNLRKRSRQMSTWKMERLAFF